VDFTAMPNTYAGQPSSFYASTGGTPQEGAYYSGRRYLNGQLLAPGQDQPDHQISNEVIGQTNPNNVQYVQQQRVNATDLQSPVNLGLPSGQSSTESGLQAQADAARTTLNNSLATQKAEADRKLVDLQTKEQATLGNIQQLSTPFRQDLETTQREKLYVNQNFEANQKLTDELDQLLTEGNNLIKQQQQVTGLAAIRNPRVQKTMEDVNARVGVIQAVMNARNSQIGQAYNMIDRTANAIAQDRQDQISYYQTVLSLNRQDMLSLDTQSKKLADEQLSLLKVDLSRAQDTQDYVKKLLINPDTAGLMGEAGVTLNDSVGQINAKLKTAQQTRDVVDMSNKMALSGYTVVVDPSGVPANQLVTITDSSGGKHYYRKIPTGAGGFDTSGFLQTLSEQGFKVAGAQTPTKSATSNINTDLIWQEALNPNQSVGTYAGKPSFAPAGGVGTVWSDPTGVQWKYTSSGWVQSTTKSIAKK
jgi:hypothetical protein